MADFKINGVTFASESSVTVSLSNANVFPSGHIINTVSSSFNGIQTLGASETDITNLSCSMTISSGNKVFIMSNLYIGQGADDYGYLTIADGNNTIIYKNTTASGNQHNVSMISTVSGNDSNDQYKASNHSFHYLWTPGVTAITVKVRGRCTYGSNLYVNRAENTTNAAYANRATSHLTIMEVVA